jgi:hypothetical protein
MLLDKLDRAYDGTCTYLLLNPTIQCHQEVGDGVVEIIEVFRI